MTLLKIGFKNRSTTPVFRVTTSHFQRVGRRLQVPSKELLNDSSFASPPKRHPVPKKPSLGMKPFPEGSLLPQDGVWGGVKEGSFSTSEGMGRSEEPDLTLLSTMLASSVGWSEDGGGVRRGIRWPYVFASEETTGFP